MTKIRLILAGCFVVVFAAGVSTGVLVSHLKARPPHRGSWLASQLKLTPLQQEQMRKIWEETMGARGTREDRQSIMRERDEAIAALMTEDQRPKYEAIVQECSRKLDELAQKRKAAMDKAIERTMEILTPEQRAKYIDLMKRGDGRMGGGSPGPDHDRRPRPGPPGAPPVEPDVDQSHSPRSGG